MNTLHMYHFLFLFNLYILRQKQGASVVKVMVPIRVTGGGMMIIWPKLLPFSSKFSLPW